jgi:hypothetical protein
MSSIIYYSNLCEKSKRLLQVLAKSACSKDIHFLCIDKREKSQDGVTHLILENGDKILLPPQVNRVPALLLLNRGNQILYGDQILQFLTPVENEMKQVATNNNGEPAPFSLTSDFMGHGVASDTYSFWDQTSDELLAKGNGGMRQMYNYSTIDYSNTGRIETPPDNYTPDKVGQVSLEQLQKNRNM